ncbi:hypothetical protein BGZ81_004357 [Podila clonocystis]|nr:hypothetical protein BGZ81_004357 [Podila clonocystis]
MQSLVKTLAIATALTSLAMSVPMEILKQQAVFNAATVLGCAPAFFAAGKLPKICKDALSIPGLIPSLVVNELTFDFTTNDPWLPKISSTSIVGTTIALGLPNPVSSLSIHADVIDDQTIIGRIETPASPASARGSDVTTSFSPVPMSVPADAHDAFSATIAAVVSSEAKSIRFRGTLDATFQLPFPFGKATIQGLAIDFIHVYVGFRGMNDITFVSLVSNTKDDASMKQTITFKVNIKSSSALGMKAGDFVFNSIGHAGPIGTTTFKDFSIKRGDNILIAIAVIDLSLPGATKFINSLDLADATAILIGSGSSPSNAAILPAIQSLNLKVVIPQKFKLKTV